jgi:hypothetical protein
MVDVSETLAPKSQQLDNIDLTHGPRTFTVTKVELRDNEEQPLWIHLAEFPRPWPPNVNMRRVIAAVWGRESDAWVGRRLTLFRDPRIKFGNDTPGGTRISHMSHIDKAIEVPVLASKGRSATYKVEPLAESPGAEAVTREDIAACESIPQLRKWWKEIPNRDARAVIDARVKELEADALGDGDPA